MLKPLTPENITDIRLSGHVIFVGRSSLEIAVKMEGYKLVDGQEVDETYMIGRFSMVCRDAHTRGAREVNPLVVSTPEEKTLFSMGQSTQIPPLPIPSYTLPLILCPIREQIPQETPC